MTYGNMPDYKLAEKMKSRFSGRGAAVSGMRASTTSELMKRAQMGGDPSVNCSELDFRNRAARGENYRPMYANYANANPAGGQYRTAENRTQNRSGSPNRTGANPAHTAGSAGTPRTSRPGNGASAKQNAQTNPRPRKAPVQVPENEEITEVRVRGRKMTPMFAVGLVIGTMMIMSIVLSFSEIYQTTSEIAQLESTLADLKDQAAKLELELEEKNDIRVIEQIATEQLGMVKEDAVQRKYVSLSDGERIDIIEDETSDTGSTASGLLLSSIWSAFGNLFDYFR
ncbi:MAG: septum formation initiator family protein [Ruminococcaceae bacterium]|nr:septum formation initiator family protein [Oscillospiraceae bacterium]